MSSRHHVLVAASCAALLACGNDREPAPQPAAAAAHPAAVTAALNDRWAALAAELPADAAAVQSRIEALQRSSDTRQGADIDLDAARAAFTDAASGWSKGQAAFATGNLAEAVAIGARLEAQYQALAVSLKMQLPSAGARGDLTMTIRIGMDGNPVTIV